MTEVPKPHSGFDENHGNGMVGWSFQLIEAFTITQVGWYAENSNGLSRAFQVGLWEGEPNPNDPGTPKFLTGSQYLSLIGDPANGLVIPSGTNAPMLGAWRVVDLSEPVTLQPGCYALGGVDTAATTDVIKYVVGGMPGLNPLTPPGTPLVMGEFFYAWVPDTSGLHPPSGFYLFWGLELGPMLFGTNSAPPTAGLSIRPYHVSPNPYGNGILLTWSSGTLQQADAVTGPYTVVTNGASPYLLLGSATHQFFRLLP